MNDTYEIIRINTIRELESLQSIWNNVLNESEYNTIYLTWEWVITWLSYYGKNNKLAVLAIKKNERIVGIIPFIQVVYRFGIWKYRVLEIIGSHESDYSGIILNQIDKDSLHFLSTNLEKLLEEDNYIVLSHLPQDTLLVSSIHDYFQSSLNNLYYVEKTEGACSFIALPPDWNSYFSLIKKKRRHNLNRCRTLLLKKHPTLKFELYHNEVDLEKFVNTFFDFKKKRWHARGISESEESDNRLRLFYIAIGKRFLKNGWLHLSVVSDDSEIISLVYSFIYNNKFYYVSPSFNTSFSEFSVGQIHIQHLIEESIQNQLKEFDFLMGDEQYKSQWGNSSRENKKIVLTKKSHFSAMRTKFFLIILRIIELNTYTLPNLYYLFLEQKRQRSLKRS